MSATLAEVAARAGVSMATASRVLNGSTRSVKQDLRQRVLEAAQDLQYVPNAHAQALVRANTSLVGVIVHDVSDPYFSEIVRGIQIVASQSGRLVTICNSYRDPVRELEYVRLLHAQRVEALILAGSGLDEREYNRKMGRQVEALMSHGHRVVFIGRHQLNGDAVVPDNAGGARAMARLLAEYGHRDIGVISGPSLLTTTRDRLEGFRHGLHEYGINLPADRVINCDFSRDAGAQAAMALIERHPQLSAIFALNDVMAIGALSALRICGVRVPEDLSVVGFDDIPIVSDVTPTLTTVHVPMADLGRRAIELALQPVSADVRVEYLSTTLVIRDSLRRLQ
jgi:LacI family transcriptional regulator